MKTNSYIKKQKKGWIVLLMLFCGLFTNVVMGQAASANQDTFIWNGATSTAWEVPTNWTILRGTSTPGTDTYPGQTAGDAIGDLVFVNKNDTPNTLVLDSQARTIFRLTISNQFGSESGSIMTINNGATLTISSNGSNNLVLAGGNLINNGALIITTTGIGFSGFPAYGINCSMPSVLPAIAREYTYSGSGTLSITLSAANFANAAAFATTAIGSSANIANVTYKLVLNNPSITLNQSTALPIGAIRTTAATAALPLTPKLIISGTGLTLGTVGTPSIGGLISVGNATIVTVDTGTVLTLNSATANVNNGLEMSNSITGTGDAATGTNRTRFTNNGTIYIKGNTSASGIRVATNSGANNPVVGITFVNNGLIDVNINATSAASTNSTPAAFQIPNGFGTTNTNALLTLTNNGTINLKNTSTAVGNGFAIWVTGAGERTKTTFTNAATKTFNIDGTVGNTGGGFTLNNNGIVNSNSSFNSFVALNNNEGASLNFIKTPAIFTVSSSVAVTEGSSYRDANLNVYTISTTKITGTGLQILAATAPIKTVPATGVLTLISGTGDATIDYSAVAGVLSVAISSPTANSGAINTAQGGGFGLSNITSTTFTTTSTSVLDPGGSAGKGIMNFARASTTLLGKITLQVSGKTTAGINYDQIISSTTNGSFDITGATLDITGIYLPTDYTAIDIIVPNSGGAVTGTFASVVGLGSGWSVKYNTGTGGTVQLVYGTVPLTQAVFTWNGSTSSDWTTAANWTKAGDNSTSTYPGESSSTDWVVVNSTNAPNPVILTTGNTFTVGRVTVNNADGALTGAVLTIDSGATLNIVSASISNLLLNGGNIVNNGAINITTTAPGSSGFPVYGISCGNPTNLPTVATEYGISGSGTLNITLSAANLALSSAIVTTGTTSELPTYKIAMNGTVSLNQGSAATISAVRTTGGTTANKLILAGAGFTVGTVGSPSIGSLINLGAGTSVAVNSGTTLTFHSANNYTGSVITGFSTSATATNLTNNGTINILGSSSRSGMGFSTGSSGTASVYNISNTGTLNINLSAGTTGHSAFNIGNGGGGAANENSVVNFENTSTGIITFKNTSTVVGTGNAIYGSTAAEAPRTIFTNDGIMNLEGATYNFGTKMTINNNGTVNSNSEFRSLTALNNNPGGAINFVKTDATATTKQVNFNGVAVSAAASPAAVYTDGDGRQYTVVIQKYNSFGTSITTNTLASTDTSLISTTTGTLTKVSGTGDASIAFGAVAAVIEPPTAATPSFSASSAKGALSTETVNSGTINTDTASNLSIISGVSAASTGTIAPGGASGKGIADFSKASTLTIASTLKLNVSGDTTAGVDYDQITNSATGGGFDLTAATLDVTGIYAPSSGYTVIDVITTNATGTLTGTFASVVGLGTGWSVVYNSGAAGTVQLVYDVPAPPTITKLSSNGTNTIASACAGSTLTILGTKFTGTTGVTVNGVALTGVTIVSSTQINAVLPAEATAGVITVTTALGTASSASFTVVANTINVTNHSACDSYTWPHNGQTYTTSGTYTGTTTNCVTEQLNLIITNSSTLTTVENICGTSYVWPSNGVTYTASGSYTIPVGCTTETLQLTLTPTVTPTFTQVDAICSGATMAALPTTSSNGITGTWSPALNNAATTTYTFTPAVGQCANKATMIITVNELTTAGSVTTSICAGSTYHWDANNTDYTTTQTGLTYTVGCNVATLNLTIAPAPASAGTNGNLEICAGTSVDEAALFAALGGTAAIGGTWSATTGGAGTYTYTQAATSPCTLDNTATVTVTELAEPNAGTDGTLSVATGVIPTESQLFAALTGADANGSWTNEGLIYTYTVEATSPCTVSDTSTVTVSVAIPASFAVCAGTTISAIVGTTSLKFYKDVKPTTTALDVTTVLKATATYFVTQLIGGVESTPRKSVVVTVNALPATPSAVVLTNEAISSITAVTAVGLYAGENTPFKLTATAVGAVSYKWSLPTGVVRTNSIGTITDSNATSTDAFIYVKFTGTGSATPLVISVQSVNASGCISVPKPSAALTRLLPAAPAAIVVTDTSLPVPPGKLAAAPVKSFAIYMGSPKVLTLTATPSPTATSYAWELPAGVTQLSGGNSNIITVNFAGVTDANTGTYTDAKGILTHVLRIGVKAVNGVGSSIIDNQTKPLTPSTDSKAKLVILTAVKPAAPALVLNNPALTVALGAKPVAIAAISGLLGQNGVYILNAKVSPLASSYVWNLPGDIVSRVTEAGTLITDVTNAERFSTQSDEPFIYVKFNKTTTLTAGTSIWFGVKAQNGIGLSDSSTANTTKYPELANNPIVSNGLLKLVLALPTVGKVGGTIANACANVAQVYTIAPSLASSYVITAPAGTVVTSPNNLLNATNVLTTSDLTFTVNYNNLVITKAAKQSIVITAINQVGTNAKDLLLAITTVTCAPSVRFAAPKASSGTENFNVIAYPNPSSDVFTLDIQSSGKGNVTTNVQVYDMTGRLIEQRQSASNSVEIGNNYPTGVYNVIVNQGENTKTVRVIKR